MWSVFEKEIKKAITLFNKKDYPSAFNQLLATTVIMKDVDHWWHDVETPEDVEELMKKLKAAYTKLFTKTDQELGIAGENSRDKLIAYLKKWGDEIKEDDGTHYEYEFDWY